MSYLKFCVQNQFFVIPIAFIDQIIPYVNPVELGDNKETFHELINLRGEIIPCLDFSYFVNKNKSGVHLNTRIIILRLQSKENGIKKNLSTYFPTTFTKRLQKPCSIWVTILTKCRFSL